MQAFKNQDMTWNFDYPVHSYQNVSYAPLCEVHFDTVDS